MSDVKSPSLFQQISYKVVYPFWPKEMRDIIDKYKLEGTLNLKGVYFFSDRIFGMNLFLFISFIALIPTTKSNAEILVLSIFGLFAPIIFFIYCPKHYFKPIFAPYVYGKETILRIKNVYYKRNMVVKIVYTNPLTGLDIIGNYVGKVWLQEDCPKNGNEIIVYVTDSDEFGVMPDTKHAKEYFSLTTTIIDKDSNHAS